jgi:hypothetical protein
MRSQTPTFRLTAALTTAALMLGSTAMSAPARAQPATQPFGAQPEQNVADPPARVGRLVTASGAVSYHAAGDTQWTPATMNFPVASGSSFWTEPTAQAELELSASRVGLAGGTEVDIGTLDANGLQATLTQGEVLLRPRDLETGETWTLVTPRGTVTTSHPSRIEVIAGDIAAPTVVSVLEGEATIAGPGLSQTLTAGQAATITGTDTLQATVGPAIPDTFASGEQARDRPRLPPPASARPVPPPPAIARLPGGDDLQGYGVWNTDQAYGQVWYPSVDPTWVPYRQGHWAFILPWGWTWVDDAPWGFAPFHYGRWVQLRGRWGWTPEFDRDRPERYPVYAPALVTFLGLGVAASIGWIPLGPREPYRPWFHASPRYIGAVNGGQVVNVATAGGFRNQRAATMVPASAMTSSLPIRQIAQPIGVQTLATARPLTGLHPLQPSATTAGVTPVAAQQLRLAPAGAGFVHAPGPAIVPRTATEPLPILRPPTPVVPGSTPIAPRFTAPVALPPVGTPPHPGPQLTAPPVVQHPTPTFGAPPVGQYTPTLGAPPVIQHPAPQFTAPPVVQHSPPPVVHYPTPGLIAPPPVQHPPPPVATPAPHFQAPPPPVQHFQAAPPPPVQHFQAAPPPPVHVAPPPPPQVHVAPPPQPHPAPPPAPPPHQKRPGEP